MKVQFLHLFNVNLSQLNLNSSSTKLRLNLISTSFQPKVQINFSLNINLNSTSTITSTQYGCDIKATQFCQAQPQSKPQQGCAGSIISFSVRPTGRPTLQNSTLWSELDFPVKSKVLVLKFRLY